MQGDLECDDHQFIYRISPCHDLFYLTTIYLQSTINMSAPFEAAPEPNFKFVSFGKQKLSMYLC